jgi:biofilm PGA synthesis N-glycosyltransferase PgaC
LYTRIHNPFRNRLFIQFVSHKLLRLLAPWMLVLLFAATVMSVADSEISSWIVIGQAVFYIVAALGILLKRLPLGVRKLLASFLLLNIWAALAPFHYLRGKLSPRWR